MYRFYDTDGEYICEVRYGGAAANALQRGLWTNTKRAFKYFDSITNGWIDYSHNLVLVQAIFFMPLSHRRGTRGRIRGDQARHPRLEEEGGAAAAMNAPSLFADVAVDAPQTEGVKYAGSKLKLLPYILQLVRKVEARNGPGRVFRHDKGFTGAGQERISRSLQRRVRLVRGVRHVLSP